MEVTQHIAIDTPAERVWSILGGDFAEISTWAARMLDSRGDDGLGDMGGRQVTTVEYGPATEILYVLDDATRTVGYSVSARGMPPVLDDVTTEWRVVEDGDGSVVHIHFTGVVSDTDMQPMVEQLLNDGMRPLLEELKFYAETGHPHANNAPAQELP